MKRYVYKNAVPVFYEDDFRSILMMTGHGFSVYQNILIAWDEDHDPRILNFIDSLDPAIQRSLLAAQESKGCISLLWKDNCFPKNLQEGLTVEVDLDSWLITSSTWRNDDENL